MCDVWFGNWISRTFTPQKLGEPQKFGQYAHLCWFRGWYNESDLGNIVCCHQLQKEVMALARCHALSI